MNITPLAFDSFGARSMATYVETDDVRILIDPGVALGPKRYGLPPHEKETQRMNELWDDVTAHAACADVLIVSHYHYDHHDPHKPELSRDKILYIKDPKHQINYSQKNRAKYFLEQIEGLPKEIITADATQHQHGDTQIVFSPPVYHGTNRRLGYVIETLIDDGTERCIHTSDVEGPALNDQVAFILTHNPTTLILDGPMTYLLHYAYSKRSLKKSIENIGRIIDETEVQTIIPDHHFTRDLLYRDHITELYAKAHENDVRIITAAEYAGREIELLEARREELYATSS
jgi:hypothetical protein